jgi:peptidoglycan hydrolase CwlO-like protein
MVCSAQQQLVRLEALERDNAGIVQSLKEEGVKCEELSVAAEDMKQQLSRAQRELVATRERLREGEGERERDQDEATELQQQLLAKEEVVCQERERCEGLQAQLSGVATAHEALRSKVVELEEANAALQRENEELHNTAVPAGPSYSTPFRSTEPPSLHDELSRHGNLSGQALPSPLVGVENGRHGYKRESCRLEDRYDYSDTSLHGNLSLEELEQMAQSSSNKFHSKTEVMVRLLSELLNTSRPLPPHPTSSHSSDSITEISHTKRQKDGNMRQLVACVKKLYSEKKQLKCQVAELQAQLEQCRHEEVDAAVQTTPPLAVATPTEPIKPTLVAATQTEPLPPLLVHRSPLAMCAHFVSRVTRGIAWAMFLLVLLLLLLCLVVWVQAEVRLCCCGGLSPGGMVWALLQPQVTVTHHGHI